jgi:hypothetical protein
VVLQCRCWEVPLIQVIIVILQIYLVSNTVRRCTATDWTGTSTSLLNIQASHIYRLNILYIIMSFVFRTHHKESPTVIVLL